MKILNYFIVISLWLFQVCFPQFIDTGYTKVISILNEAVYYSETLSLPSRENVEKRLNQYREKFKNTVDILQDIRVFEAGHDYSLFINEPLKLIYVVMRGTKPIMISDVIQDVSLFAFESAPRNLEISALMGGKVSKLQRKGYKIIVSGHSLGGTLALFACAKHLWVSHCEVHNPLITDFMIMKIGNSFYKDEMKDKVFIQQTIGEWLSSTPLIKPLGKFNVPYSTFEMPSNIKGLNKHQALSLFAQCFLKVNGFDFKDFESSFVDFLKTTAFDFSSNIKLNLDYFTTCEDGQYLEILPDKCKQCPQGHYCIVGVKIPCWPGTYASLNGADQCKTCESGYYTLKNGSEKCQVSPAGYKCPNPSEEPILIVTSELDNTELKILQNEGVCTRIYYKNEAKAIGVGYYIDNTSNQNKVKDLLTLSDEELIEILNGEDSLNLKQTRILFDESLKTAKSDAQELFPSFQDHNKKIQNVLIDLLFDMGKVKVTEFRRFKAYLEKKDYQNAAQELIYVDSIVEDKKYTDYYQKQKNRCLNNANILSLILDPIYKTTSNLQRLSKCTQKNKQCISEMDCFSNPTCIDPKKSINEKKEKIPCIFNCMNEHKLYQFMFTTPEDKIIPLFDYKCSQPYLQMSIEVAQTPELHEKGISYIDPITVIKTAKQQVNDQNDPITPIMLKILNKYQFCSTFEYMKLLREFYEDSGNVSSNQQIDDAIEQKSQSSTCQNVYDNSSSLTLSFKFFILILLISLLI